MSEPRPDQSPFVYETALHSFREYGFSRQEAEAILGAGSEEDQQGRYIIFQEIAEALSAAPHVGAESIRLMFHGWNDTLIPDAGFVWDEPSGGFRHRETGIVVPEAEIFDHIPPFNERWQLPDGPEVVKEGLLQGAGLSETEFIAVRPERSLQDEIDEIAQELEAESGPI